MKRSKHSLSYYNLLSCNMGQLVPIGLTEVLPGDTFQHATSALVRVSPLLAPVMHPVHIKIHHWFIPHRLLWEDWEDFITGGPDGFDASTFPTINLTYSAGPPVTGTNTVGSLADYLGVPPEVNNLAVSALPFRGYAKVFNDCYRDQDLVAPVALSEASGLDSTTNTSLLRPAWEKDYFTSSRPWTQKGPEVTIPLTGNAPVIGIGTRSTATFPTTGVNIRQSDGSTSTTGNWQEAYNGSASQIFVEESQAVADYPYIRADLSDVTAASVNDLRLALALQRYEEARAQYGSRYTEYLRYLGVRSSDARLQRPEYLGGGKQTIQFSEVLQTAPTTDGDDEVGVGNIKGHGIGAMRSNRYRRFFEEHGYILSLMYVMPKTVYVQGLSRTWNRRTKEDFWQRELQHVGAQEVLNKEVYAPGPSPDAVFGYQDRYDEYRRSESRVSGEFRTSTLDYWHMARKFAAAPVLNSSFVTGNPTDRVFAVGESNANTLWVMVNHSIQARRLVSKEAKSFIY